MFIVRESKEKDDSVGVELIQSIFSGSKARS